VSYRLREADSRFHSLGIFLVQLLTVGVALHFTIGPLVYFYREAISSLLFVICLVNIRRFRKLSAELWLILILAAIVSVTLALPTQRRLYENVGDLTPFQSEWPRLHQLRSATLYLPLVAYLSMRGLSRNDVRSLAVTMILSVPASLFAYVALSESVNFSNIALFGGGELGYLDYIPMLVFFGLASGYLFRSGPGVMRLICAAFSACIVVWISIVSSGRQNVLFAAVAGFVFVMTVSSHYRARAAVCLMVLFAVTTAASFWYVGAFGASAKLIDRYGSFEKFADANASDGIGKNSRYALFLDGLLTLEPGDLAFGVGPEACEGPGPHCDYVRQIQRRGLVAAVIAYASFALALARTLARRQGFTLSPEDAWIALMLVFPLFYAMFGFPQEDACKAFASFLGLGIALGVRKSRQAQKFLPPMPCATTRGKTCSLPEACDRSAHR